jgi:mercuric reductase
MAAAIRASESGASVAIVEEANVVGGTCVNIGCIPSKYLIEAAHQYYGARVGFPGIAPCEPQLAWERVLSEKRSLVDRLRQAKYLDVLDAHRDVTLLHGRAEFLGSGLIRVGEREIQARTVIIATGTRPSMPPIPGLQDSGALDSTTAMELERLGDSLIVIGGGSIGLELGQAFARFGVRVSILEAMPRILPNEDPEISAVLAEALATENMDLRAGAHVARVDRTARGYVVTLDGDAPARLEAAALLVATGRRPNTGALGLAAVAVRTDGRGFIEVDGRMRTSSRGIFAAGDVTGGPGFVYVAALQGTIAAQAALAQLGSSEEPVPIDLLTTVPRVTFTDPQVAAVGMTDAEARQAGLEVHTASLPVRHLARAAVSYRSQGVVKLVAEAGSDRLLGAHIVAPNAGDVIGEAALAIRFGLTTRDLVSTLHPYLTWGEGLKLAAQAFTQDVTTLSCCA